MVGQSISHYRIEKKLGSGGMGEVYLAYDTNLDRHVALKILPSEFVSNPERLRRFVREAKAASQLNHPNVAHIYEISEEHGIHFIAMEFIEGESLEIRMSRTPMSSAEIAQVTKQALEALQEAHEKGVIHRDIKPANIMLSATGRVKLVDFGLAKVHQTDPNVGSLLTTTSQTELGTVMGTLPYMSPEQLLGRSVDHRSDFFSFGVVLYQLATSRLPFRGDTGPELADAIIHASPPSIRERNRELPDELVKTISRLLAKDPAERYDSAREILSELQNLWREEKGAATLHDAIRKPLVMFPLLILLIGGAVTGWWLIHRNQKMKWAREDALPQITKLVDEGKYFEAVNLGSEAEKYIPQDPMLKTLWTAMSITVSIQTTPAGAEVFMQEYKSPDESWKSVGKTPLVKMRMPKGFFRLKIVKSGFPEIGSVAPRAFWEQNVDLKYSFENYRNAPAEMVLVPGFHSDANSLSQLENARVVDDYWMDRYEVSNQDYQKFVDNRGYQNHKYWKIQFLQDGKELTFEEAIRDFHDSTGRPAPMEWEVGKYPLGQERLPVTGISWYEAAAYAEFAGKNLPTISHWYHAAGTDMNHQIIPVSNFLSRAPHLIGDQRSMSPFGTFDMAGNVKEWCWNATAGGKRFNLGGSYLEPVYTFLQPNAQSPFYRDRTLGFRCVKYLSPTIDASFTRDFVRPSRDGRKEKPVNDEIFAVLKTFYDYPKRDLNAHVELKEEQGYVTREKVTFDTAYGNERMIAYVFLPKNARPPYQTVIYFPGSGAEYFNKAEALMDIDYSDYGDFLNRSGRAFVYPVYKGTYERGGGPDSERKSPDQLREWRIQYVKDFRRTVDYLETRQEIDCKKLAYFGSSWGGRAGNIIGAVEPRLRVMILEHGGLAQKPRDPESDEINFAPRVHIPVLMINGSFDHVFPMETSQKPMFALLGTPDKFHYVFEGGHTTPRKEMIKISLDWLDRYLGVPMSNK